MSLQWEGAKAVFALCSFAENFCCRKQTPSGNIAIDGLREVQQTISEVAIRENLQSRKNGFTLFHRESKNSLSTKYFGDWRRFSTKTTLFARTCLR